MKGNHLKSLYREHASYLVLLLLFSAGVVKVAVVTIAASVHLSFALLLRSDLHDFLLAR